MMEFNNKNHHTLCIINNVSMSFCRFHNVVNQSKYVASVIAHSDPLSAGWTGGCNLEDVSDKCGTWLEEFGASPE